MPGQLPTAIPIDPADLYLPPTQPIDVTELLAPHVTGEEATA